MFGRKCWVESPLSEPSAQKRWSEGSNSFRMGVFWLLWFFWGFLFLALVRLLRMLRINHLYVVTANSQLFSRSFEMFGAHIDLSLGIRPLECSGDLLHQVIH